MVDIVNIAVVINFTDEITNIWINYSQAAKAVVITENLTFILHCQ